MLADKLKPFLDRYNELTKLLSDPATMSDIAYMTKLSKEQSDISQIRETAQIYLKTLSDIDENKLLASDPELGDLAKDELKSLEIQKDELEFAGWFTRKEVPKPEFTISLGHELMKKFKENSL